VGIPLVKEVPMGIMQTGIAKTQAMASDARADLAEVNSKVMLTQIELTMARNLDGVARRAAGVSFARQAPLVEMFDFVTTQTGALHSRAAANMDELKAERIAVNSRLKFAEKSHRAMSKLAEEGDRLLSDLD
jgi:hypothetical protein